MSVRNVDLSPQEKRVLRMYVEGLTYKEIAAALTIGTDTVKEYRQRIRSKYEAADRLASSRADLIARAYEDGLMS